jgi:TPR repeat protein
MGYFYYNGKGTTQDSEQAIYWYRKAGYNAKDSTSQYNFALIYYEGKGNVAKNYTLALHWFKKA